MLSKTLYGNYLEPEVDITGPNDEELLNFPDDERAVLLIEDEAPEQFFNGVGEHLDYDDLDIDPS